MFGWSTGKSQSLYLLLDHLSDGKEAERSGGGGSCHAVMLPLCWPLLHASSSTRYYRRHCGGRLTGLPWPQGAPRSHCPAKWESWLSLRRKTRSAAEDWST
ncbi:hypothetical protein HPP92_025416 [Vanilla planifolia]|uniref:Uncharacterized protein n=1 Tax=Vanilla planifolia TaxID=51239 RepID=A0A835PM84_VANPL|nr:hypothetical protein HPP92_025416 [Vanilla planifolia]